MAGRLTVTVSTLPVTGDDSGDARPLSFDACWGLDAVWCEHVDDESVASVAVGVTVEVGADQSEPFVVQCGVDRDQGVLWAGLAEDVDVAPWNQAQTRRIATGAAVVMAGDAE